MPATVLWDPGDRGETNLSGSRACYTSYDGQDACTDLDKPVITVGGRKLVGRVFRDLNGNGLP